MAGSICLACLALLFRPACAADIRIGVLAWLGAEDAEVEWTPLLDNLRRGLPRHRLSLHYFNLDGLADALTRGEVEFVVTNPGHYVALEASHGISRIATQVAVSGQDPAHVVGSAVVVLDHRRELATLQDLRGKTLAAVSANAFGGYQAAWAELKRRGIDPERRDVTPLFVGFPMSNVLNALAEGQADAGVIRTCLLERLIRDGAVAANRFRVLDSHHEAPCAASSPTYPGWAFAATRNTPPELGREVLLSLLALPPDNRGQFWSVPADYQPVHEMLRELRVGPYAFLRDQDLLMQVRRYWPLAAAAAAFLLFWVAYTLRVEVLVQRRTRELSEALAARDRLEDGMRASQQQMDHLSRLSILGELSGTLAHELNQPLATIANYAQSLTHRFERGNLSAAAIAQAAQEIDAEAQRAASILDGIRALARKRPRARAACDLGKLAQEAVDLFRAMLAKSPRVEIDDRLPAAARCGMVDPLQIEQVLLNLLKNALDAHLAAGVADLPIALSLSIEERRAAIAVRDRGSGLDPDKRAHLFEPFFTTKPDGLGLGLSICKTIIEAHGGDLIAEPPAEGAGTIFKFTVPLAAACPDAASGNPP
ncbi:MAG: PhnD/SsuA/transferrin family substrate-binding protein [Sulfuritalea sp.]|nr:PhnD/SsuA/transferrin family substrate-binding protein [Sulfuritalea sp.]